MAYFKINNKDFSSMVSGLKVGYETLVSDSSGRNAAGNTVVDVINRKVKVYVTFRHSTQEEMSELLAAIQDYVVDIVYLNPETKAPSVAHVYTGTPEPQYYTIQDGFVLYKPMNLNFIEL